jgi:hypothetical protein
VSFKEKPLLSFDTVHALTACLLHLRHDTPSGPITPEPLGTIVLAQDHPICPTDSRLRQLTVLQLPLLGDHRQHQDLPAALHQLADALPVQDRRRVGRIPPAYGALHPEDLDVLRDALREPRTGRLLAWAVCYDDLLADPECLAPVCRVDAVDVDGRVYQLSLRPGEVCPVVLIDERPHPDDLPATYPPLARLATAVQPTQA